MAATRPGKHDTTLLDKLIYVYSNLPDRIKFLLHFICLWWLFGLAVVLSVPSIRRYITRAMTPAVPSFWLMAWCWPVMVPYGIFGPHHPQGKENGRVVRAVVDEESPLLREAGGRSPDDSAHDGDDEWEDVDSDDDDDDVDSEEEEDEDEEEQDDRHPYKRQGGGVIYLIRS